MGEIIGSKQLYLGGSMGSHLLASRGCSEHVGWVFCTLQLYFLVSQVWGFLIFCGICSNILFLLSCWGCLTSLEQWWSWWGKQETRELSQELVPGWVRWQPLMHLEIAKLSLNSFPIIVDYIYPHACPQTEKKKIVFPYNLGGKKEIDHYCFPSLNTLEVIRVLMKASVWCWVWKGM